MTYELLLTGGKKITITEEEKQILIEAEKKNKSTKTDGWVTLGKNRFKLSVIKGIFYQVEEVKDNKEQWLNIQYFQI